MTETTKEKFKFLKFFFNKRFISYGIFWSWNIIFAIFTFSLVIPKMLISMITFTIAGGIPYNFAFFTLLVVLVPFASIVIGLTKLRKEPFKLLKLFYGIEIPLFMICILRLLVFRELNPGTTHLYILLFAGIAIYFVYLLSKPENHGKYKKVLFFIGSNLLLIIGIYVAVIVLFYAVPILVLLAEEFIKFKWIKIFSYIFTGNYLFISFISVLFFAYTSTVFIGMPVALSILYTKNFKENLKTFKESFGVKTALSVATVIIALNIILFTNILNTQPQVEAFRLLKDKNLQTISLEEKEELIYKSEVIRKGLLNAYLSPYRYISSVETNNHIKTLYKNTFKIMDTRTAQSIQNLYNIIVQPFLYNGNRMAKDQRDAENLYEFFFDTPIQKKERVAVKNAMGSTWHRDGAQAGLLNINEEKVLLTKQAVDFEEHGSWAEITVSEVYENKTTRMQEVLYYFTMPENSVLTGLWLSDEENNPEKYPYSVSPRGAAQKVYRSEMRRKVDPSLLEQVGFNQYRLRAFPVPRKRIRNKEKKETEKLYLKFRFITMGDKERGWPMPKLSEKRNVYWSNDTIFTINNEEMEKSSKSKWLPEYIESVNEIKEEELSCIINDSLKIKVSKHKDKIFLEKIEGKYAVLIDPSYSMNKIKDETKESIEWIKDNEVNADIFRFDSGKPELIKDNNPDLIYFGGMDVFTMLKEFSPREVGKNYKAIIVLTDKGSYERTADHKESLNFFAPVYIVHQDRKYPPAYNDALLETIKKSKGGAVPYLPEVFETMNFRKLSRENRNLIKASREVKWEMEDVDPVKNYNNSGLEPLAASMYINSLVENTQKPDLKDLDKIHLIAKKYSIVTPYSSMIVLVNDWQKEALKDAEKQNDRFKRKVEKGKEVLSKPVNPFEVKGTPEPEEWVLLMVVMVFLGYMKRRSLVKSLH